MNTLKKSLEEKELFIFDLDGTLIDSLSVWNKADQLLLKKLTGKMIDENYLFHMRDTFLGSTTAKGYSKYDAYHEYLKELFELNATAEEIGALRDEYATYCLKEEVKLMPYALKTIRELKALKKKLALATMSSTPTINLYDKYNKNVSQLDFYTTFDKIVTINELINGKPDKEIHDRILKSLEVDREKAIIFEDSEVGITCANNAGIDSVYLYGTTEKQEKIHEKATYSVKSLRNIYEILPKKR